MSRTTVRYIQMPMLKSFLTSCRRTKARCETLIVRNRPRRREELRPFAKEAAASPKKEVPAAAAEVKPPEPPAN